MAQIGNTNAYDSTSNVTMNTQRASGMPEVGDDGGKQAITSTNIEAFSNNMKIGFIQSLTPSESRTITKVQELGSEGVVQSVPGNTNGGQLSISRFAVYNASLWNALGLTPNGQFTDRDDQIAGSASALDANSRTYGNPFKTLKDQRVPIEFKVKTKIPNSTNHAYYIETYLDCWLSSYSKTIAATTITVTESATIQYSDVTAQYASSSN